MKILISILTISVFMILFMFPTNIRRLNYIKQTEVVSVVLPEQKYNAVMVGNIYFEDANCAVLEKQKLLILQDDRITSYANIFKLLARKNSCFSYT